MVANALERGDMGVSETARRAGWNLNSSLTLAVGLISVASSVGMAVWVTANKSRDVEDLQGWRTSHEQVFKDRQTKIETRDARVDERLKSIEDRQSSTESDVKLLTQRTQANEQAVGQILASIKELTTSVNDMSGDVKVMRAIVQRQDAGVQTGVR